MATGEGLPSLPKKYVEKILAGEYIDFAELPPAKGKVKSIPNTVEGQIVVVQVADLLETRKLIPDLATWVLGGNNCCINAKALDPCCKVWDEFPGLQTQVSWQELQNLRLTTTGKSRKAQEW